jgi:hypothetical protein
MAEKGGVPLLHIVAATLLLQLCYLVTDALFTHLYAKFPKDPVNGTGLIVSYNLSYIVMWFGVTSMWIFSLIALIHPLRVAKEASVSIPGPVLAAFIVFMCKLGVDSIPFLWTHFGWIIRPVLCPKKRGQVMPAKNGSGIAWFYVIQHVLHAMFFCVFMSEIYELFDQSAAVGI